MGYTQHWFRPPVIEDDVFRRIRADFEKLILPLADMGVPLAGGNGRNEPEIGAELIRFNGVCQCGHPKNEEILVPYPTDDARGLGSSATAIAEPMPMCRLVVKVRHRCCAGECCHETFSFPQVTSIKDIREDDEAPGLVFSWTKTAFKPYDIAVTAALLIAKRHLRDRFIVHTNGLDAQWADAKDLCQRHLGYGAWFGIIEDPRQEMWPGPNGTKVAREVCVRVLVEIDPTEFRL